jgi:hypothetical protein
MPGTRYDCWCLDLNRVSGTSYRKIIPFAGTCYDCGEKSEDLAQSSRYDPTINTTISTGVCKRCKFPCRLVPIDEGVIDLVRKVHNR